jgi:hypothetical protein
VQSTCRSKSFAEFPLGPNFADFQERHAEVLTASLQEAANLFDECINDPPPPQTARVQRLLHEHRLREKRVSYNGWVRFILVGRGLYESLEIPLAVERHRMHVHGSIVVTMSVQKAKSHGFCDLFRFGSMPNEA